MTPDFDWLTGRTERDLVALPESGLLLHREVVGPLAALRELARQSGFQLQVASAFRGFEAQRNIWNAKATGQRPLLDDKGKPLDFAALSPSARVEAILRWSALPGASRHHWGTDFDIFPANLGPAQYRVQLVPAEIAPGGPYEAFGQWLEHTLPEGGFYRPYETDRGGVAPEWWHLSYAPLAQPLRAAYTLEVLKENLNRSDLALKDELITRAHQLYDRFVNNVADAP